MFIRQKKIVFIAILLFFVTVVQSYGGIGKDLPYKYAVVVKIATYNRGDGWDDVCDTLIAIHGKGLGTSRLFLAKYSNLGDVKDPLSEFAPDYIAFVGRPALDISVGFIHSMHTLVRELDDDPYIDAVYSVVTGYVPADAIRAITDTLIVKTGLQTGGNNFLTVSPGPGTAVYTNAAGEKFTEAVGSDRIPTIAKCLNNGAQVTIGGTDYDAPIDIFATGGHGNKTIWQAHYPDAGPEGFLRSKGGRLYADPRNGSNININKNTPTIYLAINNCLIGNPDNPDNMVYAWFHRGGAVGMFGYIVDTWASHSGFAIENRARAMGGINMAEAYFLGQNNFIWAIETDPNGQNPNSTAHNISHWSLKEFTFNLKETVVYGDPKANALFKEGDGRTCHAQFLDYTITYAPSSNRIENDTFELEMVKNDIKMKPWAWWQGWQRPILPLPVKIDPSTITILQDDTYCYEIIDNTVFVDAWRSSDVDSASGTTKILKWTAKAEPAVVDVAVAKTGKVNMLNFNAIILDKSQIILNINNIQNKNLTFSLYDINGKKILTKSQHFINSESKWEINTKNTFSAGFYIAELKSEVIKVVNKITITE